MKKILLFTIACICTSWLSAQFVYKIKADSVLITNDSCTAELNLENKTKDTLGFLYNKGKGRTEFRRMVKKIDSVTYVIGGTDTIITGGSFIANTIYTGDGSITGNRNVNFSTIGGGIFFNTKTATDGSFSRYKTSYFMVNPDWGGRVFASYLGSDDDSAITAFSVVNDGYVPNRGNELGFLIAGTKTGYNFGGQTQGSFIRADRQPITMIADNQGNSAANYPIQFYTGTNFFQDNTNSIPTLRLNGDQTIDVKSTIRLGNMFSDPTGSNGMLYYNSTNNKFRGYQNGGWMDIIGGGSSYTASNGLRLSGTTVMLDNGSNPLTANVTIDGLTNSKRIFIFGKGSANSGVDIYSENGSLGLTSNHSVYLGQSGNDSASVFIAARTKFNSNPYTSSFSIATFKDAPEIDLKQISSDQTITFVPANTNGYLLLIHNQNTSGFSWLTSGPVVKADGTAITSIPNQSLSWYKFDKVSGSATEGKWVQFTDNAGGGGGGTSGINDVLAVQQALTANRTINTATFNLGIVGNANSNPLSVWQNSTSSTQPAVYINAAGGNGYQVQLGTSNATGYPGYFQNAKVNTGSILEGLTLHALDGGTSLDGIGIMLKFMASTTTTSSRISNMIEGYWFENTDATRTSYYNFKGVNSAATETYMQMQPDWTLVNNLADTLATRAYARSVGGGGGSGSGLGDPGGNGFAVRTALNTTIARTIIGTSNKINVTFGDGFDGNPSLNVGSDIVDKTASTSYSAGAKQSFSASSTAADIRLTGAASDPSSLSAGDIWYNTTSNVFKARFNTTTRQLATLDGTETLTNKSIDASQLTGTVASARLTNIKQAKGITIVSPASGENATIFYTTVAITIEEVRAVMLGSGQSIDGFTINYGSSRASATNTIVPSNTFDFNDLGYQTSGVPHSLNIVNIPAGNYIWFTTTTVAGTINDLNITITYRQQ